MVQETQTRIDDRSIVKERGSIKVLFITDSLYPIGGVERVLGRILRYLDQSIVSPMALVLGPYHNRGLKLPQYVPVRYLGKKHARNAIVELVHIIKTSEPDVIYSAKTHVNVVAVLASQLAGRSSCIIPSEHIHLSARLRNQPALQKRKWQFIFLLAQVLYCWAADKIVFVSKEALQDGCARLRLPDDKATVVYNPIVEDALFGMSEEAVEHPWFAREREEPIILAVGRLTRQKGFSYLLKAFCQARSAIPARLVLIGEGEDHQQLTDLVVNP